MVETSLSYFDLAVFTVLGLSAMFALFRGFIREVVSFGLWIGAGLITIYLFPHVAKLLMDKIADDMVASGLAAVLSFVAAWIGLTFFNMIFLRFVKTGAEVGFLDNLLGLIFGLARGALLVILGYFVLTAFIKEGDEPAWLEESISRPYIEDATAWVIKVAPDYFERLKTVKKDAEENDEPSALDRLIERGPSDEDAEPSPRWQSMEELQRRMRGESEE